MDNKKFDFSMDTDVPIGKFLSAFNLRIQNAKLKGQDVSTFNKLSNWVQFARKSWHIEVASNVEKTCVLMLSNDVGSLD
jgi:hypothetical protein